MRRYYAILCANDAVLIEDTLQLGVISDRTGLSAASYCVVVLRKLYNWYSFALKTKTETHP
jgi:hypothetical protein